MISSRPRRCFALLHRLVLPTLFVAAFPCTHAQSAVQTATSSTASAKPAEAQTTSIKTFYLTNVSQQSDANELVVALRNILDPRVKIFFVPSQNAFVMSATSEQLELAARVLRDLDRPKKTYRLTYTLTAIEDGKRVGTEHFSIIVVTGQRTTLKQGSKVPVQTGAYDADKDRVQTQFTYLDVGMNFDASLDEFVNGIRLRTKVEQSSVATESSGAGPNDPIVRQTVFEGTSFLAPGKPLLLGSLDIPGTPRHLDITVVMELVP